MTTVDVDRWTWERAVRSDPRIIRTTLTVALLLATYANADGGNVRPGVRHLAEQSGLGESTVRKHVTLLTDNGFLRQERRGHRTGAGEFYTSVFHLTTATTAAVETLDAGPVDNSPSTVTPVAVEDSSTATPGLSTATQSDLYRYPGSTYQNKTRTPPPARESKREAALYALRAVGASEEALDECIALADRSSDRSGVGRLVAVPGFAAEVWRAVRDRRSEAARRSAAPCPDHGQFERVGSCRACAADHAAGEHTEVPVAACPRCRAERAEDAP